MSSWNEKLRRMLGFQTEQDKRFLYQAACALYNINEAYKEYYHYHITIKKLTPPSDKNGRYLEDAIAHPDWEEYGKQIVNNSWVNASHLNQFLRGDWEEYREMVQNYSNITQHRGTKKQLAKYIEEATRNIARIDRIVAGCPIVVPDCPNRPNLDYKSYYSGKYKNYKDSLDEQFRSREKTAPSLGNR